MSTLSNVLYRTQTFRKLHLAGASVACVVLLSGCAVWPKALTFWSKSEPAAADTTNQPTASAPSAVASAPMEPPSMVTSNPVVEPARPEVASMVSLPPEPASAALAAPPKPSVPVKMERGYYINVGLFAVPSNGSNAFHKLEKAGLPAYTEWLETNVGKLTRVRVGGFPNKAQADDAAKKIRSLQLEAIVFRYK